ncbi:uncharacterized protein LOC117175524 [Belonocnema kinseyi]|uniref:uncharacterized protein LOC117175524 n=1 Tax=Belonocnema kinseyi TaxID=2817044 RepID=UPI00143D8524|nr:uncharacterized protein LOC117175524 [Belonocnema kinseyi]
MDSHKDLKYSNDKYIDSIQIGDKHVQILARVGPVEAPKKVTLKDGKEKFVVKFMLMTDSRSIRCSAWDSEVEKIVKIKSMWASRGDPRFNSGNVGFILYLKSSSVITRIDSGRLLSGEIQPTSVDLCDIFTVEWPISTMEYLMDEFQIVIQKSPPYAYMTFKLSNVYIL